MSANTPIGVFDSGLGGLTVVRAIRARLPAEPIIYLGDNARVPYGTRSAQTVRAYARACAARLSEHDIKLLVVACNTVSAVALTDLAEQLRIPVLGVIEPGARAGVAATRVGRVGVLATAATVSSGAYPRAVAAANPGVLACMHVAPLLVPLAEEGWVEGEVPELVSRRYLEPVLAQGVDALVLGCTHYPLLRPTIERVAAQLAGTPVPVVDSAVALAEELAGCLVERGLSVDRAPPGGRAALRVLVTDMPGRFHDVAQRFFGEPLDDLEQIDL